MSYGWGTDAAGGGFTDTGTSIRLTTVTDRLDLRKLATATGAASQSASSTLRLVASMWTGAAEAERTIDVHAGPSTVAADESVSASVELQLDSNGYRFLTVGPHAAAPSAAAGALISNTKADGANPNFEFFATANIGASNPVFRIRDALEFLFRVDGSGVVDFPGSGAALRIAGTKVIGAQAAAEADASGGAVIDVQARATLNSLLAKLRTHGLIAT